MGPLFFVAVIFQLNGSSDVFSRRRTVPRQVIHPYHFASSSYSSVSRTVHSFSYICANEFVNSSWRKKIKIIPRLPVLVDRGIL